MASHDVAIVGAGPVGLAAAIELGLRGVRCLVVERNDRVGYAPRAKTTNVRTRTHLRRWGIADRLAERAPFGVDAPSTVHFVTRLAGPSLARFENAFDAAPTRQAAFPEHAQWVPQYVLEQVLRERAAELPGVEFAFGTEVGEVADDGGGVTAALRPVGGGIPWRVRASYLIGADGARSTVRAAIGATMSGRRGLSCNHNIVFRSRELARRHAQGPGIMYWQVNGDVPSVIGPMDRDDVWYFVPTGVASDAAPTAEEARRMIARATGIDADYEVLRSDTWVASRLVADRYARGRVFLAGDACHLHPPFGGYGMNMGIGDAVDLGWKLAAVLRGWAAPALLDSYEPERRPVHEWIMDEAEANHAVVGNQLWEPGLEDEGPDGDARRAAAGERIRRAKAREFHTLGAVLGYRYRGSPVIAPDDEGDEGAPDAQVYRPSSRPGALAPHLWLADGRSLYDLFGDGFALLVHVDGDAALAVAEAAALGVPLAPVALPSGASNLYPRRLTLVRPDQHVAWRGDRWQAGMLATATGRSAHAAAECAAANRKEPVA